jgi:hypothetical protein
MQYPLQPPLREEFFLDVKGDSEIIEAEYGEKSVYKATVGEIKSTLCPETLPGCVVRLLVNLSLHVFLAQLTHPDSALELTGNIYIPWWVDDVDDLRRSARELVYELSDTLLRLPPDASVTVEIVRVNCDPPSLF